MCMARECSEHVSENYIGSIIDWFAATYHHREPVLLLTERATSGGSS